jgi:hypothetical protein
MLLETVIQAVAYYYMIDHYYTHNYAGGNQPLGKFFVVGAGAGISGRMVVRYDNGQSVM